MSDSLPSDATNEQPTFEEDLERLTSIVNELDNEPESLNRALELYEEGVTLAQRCLKQLEEAELRVQELSLDDEQSLDA